MTMKNQDEIRGEAMLREYEHLQQARRRGAFHLVLAGLVALGVMLGLLWLLPGCTSFMAREPISQTVTLAESPALAYQRATRAMARMGGELIQANAQTGMLQGKVHGAVLLTVQVQPSAEGAMVEVIGTVMANKVAIGKLDEVDTFVALLR